MRSYPIAQSTSSDSLLITPTQRKNRNHLLQLIKIYKKDRNNIHSNLIFSYIRNNFFDTIGDNANGIFKFVTQEFMNKTVFLRLTF